MSKRERSTGRQTRPADPAAIRYLRGLYAVTVAGAIIETDDGNGYPTRDEAEAAAKRLGYQLEALVQGGGRP